MLANHQLPLPAMIGSNPLGALSAFGLLNVLSGEFPAAKLSFEMRDDWIAVLHSPFADAEALIAWLCEWIKQPEQDARINWAEDVRMPVAEFRTLLRETLLSDDHNRLEVLSALVADGAVDKSKGLIKPTLFYMVSGQQSFLGGLKEVLNDLRQKPVEKFREVLVGPWTLSSRLHGLGLDPGGERLYALRSKSPTGEKPASVTGATWLASYSMGLLPPLAMESRPYTTGFTRQKGEDYFSWPVFLNPISIETLRALLTTAGFSNSTKTGLRQGVAAVYQSHRFTFGQGYGVFRPAKEISQTYAASTRGN